MASSRRAMLLSSRPTAGLVGAVELCGDATASFVLSELICCMTVLSSVS